MFRQPKYPAILCTACGIGAQTLFMFVVILSVTVIGLINPYLRTWYAMQTYFMLAVGGACNGYVSARMMRFFGASEWRLSAGSAAFLMPLYMLANFVFVDTIEWLEKSSAYTPFSYVFLYTILWIAITVPMSFGGAYLGFQAQTEKPPVKVSPVRRRVPTQPWYNGIYFQSVFSGFVIFGTIIGEFQYVLSSVWRSYMYAMFGLLWFNCMMLVTVVTLISVLTTYLQIQNQNWQWWWRAFCTGASAGIWMFVYSIYMMICEFKMNLFAGDVVYLTYMAMASSLFGCVCGFISMLSSYVFLTEIYSRIKND